MDGILELASGATGLQIAAAATWLHLQGSVLPSIPEEVLVTSVGVLVGQGRIAPPMAFAAVLAGLLPANAFAVFLGGLGRRRVAPGGLLGRLLGSRAVAHALAVVRRHGPIVVVATRFIPLVRGPVYLATGLSGLGLRRFVLLDAAAACVQVPLLLWLGARLGQGASLAVALPRLGWLAAGLGAAAILVAAARRAAPSVRAAPGS
ncbi:MAG TPA: VTT domain-containing protein [Anaeromyxobacteraceae bacterium]|nr:VTT domain-containing protein [Anaeromyxobacteraceae bacterium]